MLWQRGSAVSPVWASTPASYTSLGGRGCSSAVTQLPSCPTWVTQDCLTLPTVGFLGPDLGRWSGPWRSAQVCHSPVSSLPWIPCYQRPQSRIPGDVPSGSRQLWHLDISPLAAGFHMGPAAGGKFLLFLVILTASLHSC